MKDRCPQCWEPHYPYCKRKGGGNNARYLRSQESPTFIGVDGEGYTSSKGDHVYNLLSIGDSSIHDKDGGQLSFERVAGHLWSHFQDNPRSVYIGFYLGYDFTQWFRTLPESRGYMLLHKQGELSRRPKAQGGNPTPFPVRYNEWEFDVLSKIRFRLKKEDAKEWMYVCDVGGYFQTSFLKAIDPKNWQEPVCTDAEFQVIAEGKSTRGVVHTAESWISNLSDTTRYNVMENLILARMMDRYASNLRKEGISLSRDRWFGPGQAVQSWMTTKKVVTSTEVQEKIPPDVLDAARSSFYGGWFEIFSHGHLSGDTYEYDINSAYPYAMTQLPCLRHCTITPTPGDWTLYNVNIRGTDSIVGSMPCRRHNGTIARPHSVSGWYWKHELDSATKAGLIDGYSRITTFGLSQNCGINCQPLTSAVPDIYQRRLEVGKNTSHGKALKLVYNSAYGKTAQSVGKPKYANPIYASLITSICRTMILEAIATHPNKTRDLVMVATDGIYFRSPLPGLALDANTLGKWDRKCKRNLTLFMPGVYWDDTTRASIGAGQSPVLKSRGISAADLSSNISRIDEAFATDRWWEYGWPSFDIRLGFNMVSAKTAITRGKWNSAGTIDPNNIRTISSNPQSKRYGPPTMDQRGDLRLAPYPLATPTGETTPYSGTFGMMLDEDKEDWGETPEGNNSDLFAEALK